jgi:hypothetical protein
VRDSDGTVIFTMARNLTGGSKPTADAAKRLGKPWLHLSAADYAPAEKLLLQDGDRQILLTLGHLVPRHPC